MITAQFHGTCTDPDCTDPIIPGQRIVRGDDGWRHADCERLGVETVTCVCEKCFCYHAGECA